MKINKKEFHMYIVNVLSYYGHEVEEKIVCPIHDEDTPSCLIDFEHGMYYCFGCGRYGNVLTLIQEIEQCNELKAMHKLYKIINNTAKKIDYDKIIKQRKKRYINAKEAISESKEYFKSLPTEKWIRNTRAKRYLLSDRKMNINVLRKTKIKLNINSQVYPVICPILENGKFTGYVCRTIKEESDRKYLYNEGFKRAQTFQGNIIDDWVIITEGYFDWLKLKQFGENNSIAILGWKITKYQIDEILKVTDKVISALDNTPTGEKGTQELMKHFKVKRLRFYDNIKDVGEMSKYQFNYAIGGIKR